MQTGHCNSLLHSLSGSGGCRRSLSAQLLLVALTFWFAASAARPVYGQLASANISGTVRDTSGGVIPGATLTLKSTGTGFVRTATTNATGVYVIRDIEPGAYTLQVQKQGFATARQAEFRLFVNQSTTFNFVLKVGSAVQSVTVVGSAAQLETTSAELGQAINTTQVNDLPLNGRNFTEMLDLTPGVSPVDTGQTAGGGGGFVGNALGTFTFPSVNGQTNRSNLFLMDGLNDENSFVSSYNFAPIVDQVQEFRVESHNDSAEFGQALGGIVNVVTKSGTNQFHGDGWEFLRNNAFDARDTFFPNVIPFHQNQFGGAIGGPVILPGHNGRNKTFFFATYEGYRNHTTATTLLNTATPAELNGDFSAVPQQLYDPFTTTPDPSVPGQFIRQPFLNNQIPATLLNTGMVAYARALFPTPVNTGVPGFNASDTQPTITRQDEASLKLDHQFNDNNSLWIRYSGYTQPDTSAGGIPNQYSAVFLHGYQAGATYTHTFGGSAVASFQFARESGQDNIFTLYNKNIAPTLWQTAGFSPNYAGKFQTGAAFDPGIGIPGYISFGTGNMVQDTQFSDVYEYKGDFSIVHGRHNFKMGADFQSNNTTSPIFGVSDGFNSFNTANPESPSNTGNAMASYVLGVPYSGNRRNVNETEHGGWVDGFYFQDTWMATQKLTVNLGMRYDVTLMPIYGSASADNQFVGDLDLQNGTYILARVPPACGSGVGAPCIPGGTLPADVVLTPFSNRAILHNTYDNWQPRVGVAYRLGSDTVLRGSFGRFFDNWAAAIQIAQNYEGTWPTIGQLLVNNLNNPVPASPTPTASAQDPFHLGTAPPLPAPTPFNQVQWFMNPNIQNPYSDQWNFGVEHQFGNNTVLNANYVGSESVRTDIGGYNNVALTPGPGNPQSRAPFTYIAPTYYDNSNGRANYNAFQFSVKRSASKGLTYLVSYTYSKAMDFGSDGWFGAEGTLIQNPYDLAAAHSVAGYDLTHIFSGSAVYSLPFGSGGKFQTGRSAIDYVIGGWQLNSIVTLTSGPPYTVQAAGDIANTGNVTEFANLVGNPNLSNPTPHEWFNTAAIASPAPFTFGNLGRNSLRSDWFHNVDLSLFREFPLTESKRLEFRAEFFNAFNNVIYGQPDSTITDPTFGQVTSIYTGTAPRQIQLALKLYF
jgi:hypothetical protein